LIAGVLVDLLTEPVSHGTVCKDVCWSGGIVLNLFTELVDWSARLALYQ